jgi:hypothetical protein
VLATARQVFNLGDERVKARSKCVSGVDRELV